MKTYIFFVTGISEINGLIQYLYNKVRFLEKKDWRVLVFSGRKGKILVTDLRRFEVNIYPPLAYSPWFFSKKVVKETLDKILIRIGNIDDGNFVIESDSFHSAVWAELVASVLNCRNFVFLVQETHNYDERMKAFLRFKFNRHELAGINKKSINHMLGDEMIEGRDDSHWLAYCNNVFDDCSDLYSEKLDAAADYTFGSIGRLSKPCVPVIVDGFCHYICCHKDKRFNVVMIGGDERIEQEKRIKDTIRKKFKCYDNVNLVLTGNVYPIPLSFAKRFDVFVSTAGAAIASYNAGIPTIKVNPLSGDAIGIMGLDVAAEISMYEFGKNLTIEGCIDRVICNRSLIHFCGNLGEQYNVSMYNEFNRQLSFICSHNELDYYDERLLMHLKTAYSANHNEVWLIGHLFGGNGVAIIKSIWQKFRSVINK